MFEDTKPAAGAPPSNLPSEPVDMFAGMEEKQPQAPSPRPFQQSPARQPNAHAAPAPSAPLDALSAGLLKKKDTEMNIQTPSAFQDLSDDVPAYKMKGPVVGKVIMVLAILVIIFGGGWWVYAKFMAKPTPKQKITPATYAEDKTTATPQAGSIVPDQVGTVEPNVSTPAPQLPAGDYGASQGVTTSTQIESTTTEEVPNKMKNDTILFGEAVDTDKDGLDDIRENDLGTDISVTDTDADGLSDGDEVIIWKTDPLKQDTDGDTHVDGKEVRNGYNPLGAGKLFVPGVGTSTPTNTR